MNMSFRPSRRLMVRSYLKSRSNANVRFRTVFTVLFCTLTMPVQQSFAAEDRAIEEIIVTARQQEETLQNVPVTVSALTTEQLDRYNIRSLPEASKLVPNMQIVHGNAGNGANLFLRGVGSSSISAAFDQSLAINVDGVVVNIGRFIQNAYMDMNQIEVLKGPQSLYFGKSATAGVISIVTQDPGDEWEFDLSVGLESEYSQKYYEAVISGPLSETLGARIALGRTKHDELFRNIAPGVANRYRGAETDNARLTLVLEPADTLKFRLKHTVSNYDNDGANGNIEEFCPDGAVQPTTIPLGVAPFSGVDDCRLNGNTSIADLNPALAAGLPGKAARGIPFLEQETDLTSLQVDWDISASYHLRSVTGFVDLDHLELDVYDYNAGVFGALHRNTYEALSQEFTLRSALDGPFNFMIGAYYQDVEQGFEAYQDAFNAALSLNVFNLDPLTVPLSAALGFNTTPGALFGVDPSTGRGNDYDKFHYLDTEVFSYFAAGYWDLTDDVEITAGVRFTDEEKDGRIEIPYVHASLIPLGFGGFDRVDGLEFDDDNLSPEVAINWHATDSVSVFASWKQGFKSGGIDNSALPTGALNPNAPGFGGFDFLIYDSEEAEGFEVGFKANLQDGSLRVNGTLYNYVYEDLQTQLFDSVAIQFQTINASELVTRGGELDLQWMTPVEGLSFRGALAYTDAFYDDDFFTQNGNYNFDAASGEYLGENLDGIDRERSADWVGFLGLTYDMSIGSGWRLGLSADGRYNSGYALNVVRRPYEQEEFWLVDASVSLFSEDGRYELAFIARNIGDEIVAYSAGDRPGATAGCITTDTCSGPSTPAEMLGGVMTSPTEIDLDQNVNTSLGQELMVRFRVRF